MWCWSTFNGKIPENFTDSSTNQTSQEKNEKVETQEKEFTFVKEKSDAANLSLNGQVNSSQNDSSLNQSISSCIICYDKVPDSVLLDCGHGGNFLSHIYFDFKFI